MCGLEKCIMATYDPGDWIVLFAITRTLTTAC